VYEQHRKDKGPSAIAASYAEALPYVTKIDRNRQATYRRRIGELRAETGGEPGTRSGRVTGAVTYARSRCRSNYQLQ
jgi:hypothetical protein